MMHTNRRDFLKALVAPLLLSFAHRGIAAPSSHGFEFLVVGDSLVWGQGLEEKDKFYTLTADWLRESGPRTVNVKVKAHSGSTLKFHADEAAKYEKAGLEEAYQYQPEVNVGFPSIWKQVEMAEDEYRSAGVTNRADLVMITGGITDITVAKVLDPFGNTSKLPALIEKYCRDDMYDVIKLAAQNNPAATIAVVGYFPMLSPATRSSKLLNNWLESMSFPRPLKSIANNKVTRALFFKKLRKKGIRRSRIWLEESNRGLQAAVDKLNADLNAPRAVFVRSPITEDAALETPNTVLFRMGKKGVVEDSLYAVRKAECRKALPALKKRTGIGYPVRLCEIAAVGHPDPVGSRQYAAAIKSSLAPLLAVNNPGSR